MIFKRKNKVDRVPSQDLEKEKIVLETKAEKVIYDEKPSPIEKVQSGDGDAFSAFSNVKKWAIENNYEEKTKEYLRLTMDGVVELVNGLVKESK